MGCNQEIKKPKNLIPQDKMAQIIKDFYIYKNLQPLSKFQYEEFHQVNAKILDKHSVTYEDFKKSYQYYLIEDQKYKAILEQIEAEIDEEYQVSDSLQISPHS